MSKKTKITNEKIKSSSCVCLQIKLDLSEVEARALGAIACYGSEEFIKVFYEYMGKAYLQKHEDGVHSLFATIRDELPQHLDKMDKVRTVFTVK